MKDPRNPKDEYTEWSESQYAAEQEMLTHTKLNELQTKEELEMTPWGSLNTSIPKIKQPEVFHDHTQGEGTGAWTPPEELKDLVVTTDGERKKVEHQIQQTGYSSLEEIRNSVSALPVGYECADWKEEILQKLDNNIKNGCWIDCTGKR